MLDSSIVMLYAVPVPVLLTVMVKLIVSPTAILTSFVGVFVTTRFGCGSVEVILPDCAGTDGILVLYAFFPETKTMLLPLPSFVAFAEIFTMQYCPDVRLLLLQLSDVNV